MGLRRLLAPVSLVFSMLILGGKFNANGAKFGADLALVEIWCLQNIMNGRIC